MKVRIESILTCPADAAWNRVLNSDLLLEVAAPLIRLAPVAARLPDRWMPQQTVQVRPYLLGLVPLGTRTLYFERIDPQTRQIQTREHDALVRRWDHLISINDAGDGRCRYCDELEIEAGLCTWLVWLFAQCFYRHRQRRWRRVARRISKAKSVAADESPRTVSPRRAPSPP